MVSLRLEHLTKKYNKIAVVDDISLTVNNGEYMVIAGPTGAGKTTTLKMIAGLITPDAGRIYFDDEDVTNIPPEDRNVGLLFEEYALFPHMTVLENVLYSPYVKDKLDEEAKYAALDILRMVLLDDRIDAYPSQLSGGMQQRTALARTLMAGAQILLLDQPLRALDARIRQSLRKELKKLSKTMNLTALHLTNSTQEALIIADRVAVMRRGKILQVGTPMEVYNRPKTPFVAYFMGDTEFFEGEPKKITDGEIIFEIEGKEIAIHHEEKVENGKLLLGIRPEYIYLSDKKDGNALEGIITEAKFLGDTVYYEIKLKSGRILEALEPGRTNEIHEIGDKIFANLDADRFFIFPYPKEGLEDALSLT